MRCPTLSNLPPPPPGKTGWPWTEESPQLPNTTLDGQPWPRVSIVTPSYNQRQFIEETIRSILLQGYPDLEYIVIDGGSRNGSVEIIRRYERWLAYWVSEPDRGQSHAINKGFERATGEILGWLNSDDTYLPGAIAKVARAYQSAPESVVAGPVMNVRGHPGETQRERLVSQVNLSFEALVKFWEPGFTYHQPGIFFPRRLWPEVGGLDVTLRYVMDYDLLCRMLQCASVIYVSDVIACFRLHHTSKTCSQHLAMFTEQMRVSQRYWHLVTGIDPSSFYGHATDHLVRWAGTEVLAGHYADAIAYLKTSFGVHPTETLKRLCAQFLAGIRRQTLSAN